MNTPAIADLAPGERSSSERQRELEGQLTSLMGIPFSAGNRVDVLRNGVEIFPAMLSAIHAATESIEFLTFVYWSGEIAERFAHALSERAAAGVATRVLLDAVGAAPMRRSLIRHMREAGVELKWFRPLNWRLWRNAHRTHRKILVCDREVGFTGGVGIAEEWEGDAEDERHWRDTHVRVRGPAVAGLRAGFISNWIEDGASWDATREQSVDVTPRGDAAVQVVRSTSSHGWSEIATLHRSAIMLARRTLDIASAYFVPDAETVRLLVDAVSRGVQVRVITVGDNSDERLSRLAGDDRIEGLLRGGVRLFRFAPTMMHAKIILVDRAVAIVGSANLNQRSMRKDDELCMSVLDPEVLDTLTTQYGEDLDRCVELTLANWRRRPWWRRFAETLSRLWSGQV